MVTALLVYMLEKKISDGIIVSMEVLNQIRRKKGAFAVLALPCQVHGLRKLQEVDPDLAGKIGYSPVCSQGTMGIRGDK